MSMPNKDCLKLRECPFCGGEAFINFDPEAVEDTFGRKWAFNVFCGNCCATTGICWSKEQAIEAWNRRANELDQR